ncbi:hypothetical protein SAMN05443635_103154 [Roseobacter denitrificans OCh 114]|uniref:Uncharacterized protein n=1 Tax=Roseobacter denitrificans (strain ATCC 33942 / OCh 114) TaxID=375451 RepID=Q168B5_ROSDO|nr:hypothetical protein RD1_2076 [Roseobacter denitrificans OCh 114]SFF88448.1 hypothetical protein SAMN05443635_103154 [Roseobacter denitrificans OCh 114]
MMLQDQLETLVLKFMVSDAPSLRISGALFPG